MRFDYIVIGSGSSGGILTARLTENENTSVLVLEAGQKEGHWTIRMPAATRNNFLGGPRNWCFETEPEPYMDGRRIFSHAARLSAVHHRSTAWSLSAATAGFRLGSRRRNRLEL